VRAGFSGAHLVWEERFRLDLHSEKKSKYHIANHGFLPVVSSIRVGKRLEFGDEKGLEPSVSWLHRLQALFVAENMPGPSALIVAQAARVLAVLVSALAPRVPRASGLHRSGSGPIFNVR
jgi:hypothetical protein